MTEQILPALVGALSTVSVTAVGALAWMVRRQSRNGHEPNSLGSLAVSLNITLQRQTEVLTALVRTTELHNTEAGLRQEALVKAMDTLQRFNERNG